MKKNCDTNFHSTAFIIIFVLLLLLLLVMLLAIGTSVFFSFTRHHTKNTYLYQCAQTKGKRTDLKSVKAKEEKKKWHDSNFSNLLSFRSKPWHKNWNKRLVKVATNDFHNSYSLYIAYERKKRTTKRHTHAVLPFQRII